MYDKAGIIKTSVTIFIILLIIVERENKFYRHLDTGEVVIFNDEECILTDFDIQDSTIELKLPSGHIININYYNLNDEEIERLRSGITKFPNKKVQ